MDPPVEQLLNMLQQQMDEANAMEREERERMHEHARLQDKLNAQYQRILAKRQRQQVLHAQQHIQQQVHIPSEPPALPSPLNRGGYAARSTGPIAHGYSPSASDVSSVTSATKRMSTRHQHSAEPLPSQHAPVPNPHPAYGMLHGSVTPLRQHAVEQSTPLPRPAYTPTPTHVTPDNDVFDDSHGREAEVFNSRASADSVGSLDMALAEAPRPLVGRDSATLVADVLRAHAVQVSALHAAAAAALLVVLGSLYSLSVGMVVKILAGVHRGQCAVVQGFDPRGFVILWPEWGGRDSRSTNETVVEAPRNLERRRSARGGWRRWLPAAVPDGLSVSSPPVHDPASPDAGDAWYDHDAYARDGAEHKEGFSTLFNGANSSRPEERKLPKVDNTNFVEPKMTKAAQLRMKAGRDRADAQDPGPPNKRFLTSKEMTSYVRRPQGTPATPLALESAESNDGGTPLPAPPVHPYYSVEEVARSPQHAQAVRGEAPHTQTHKPRVSPPAPEREGGDDTEAAGEALRATQPAEDTPGGASALIPRGVQPASPQPQPQAASQPAPAPAPAATTTAPQAPPALMFPLKRTSTAAGAAAPVATHPSPLQQAKVKRSTSAPREKPRQAMPKRQSSSAKSAAHAPRGRPSPKKPSRVDSAGGYVVHPHRTTQHTPPGRKQGRVSTKAADSVPRTAQVLPLSRVSTRLSRGDEGVGHATPSYTRSNSVTEVVVAQPYVSPTASEDVEGEGTMLDLGYDGLATSPSYLSPETVTPSRGAGRGAQAQHAVLDRRSSSRATQPPGRQAQQSRYSRPYDESLGDITPVAVSSTPADADNMLGRDVYKMLEAAPRVSAGPLVVRGPKPGAAASMSPPRWGPSHAHVHPGRHTYHPTLHDVDDDDNAVVAGDALSDNESDDAYHRNHTARRRHTRERLMHAVQQLAEVEKMQRAYIRNDEQCVRSDLMERESSLMEDLYADMHTLVALMAAESEGRRCVEVDESSAAAALLWMERSLQHAMALVIEEEAERARFEEKEMVGRSAITSYALRTAPRRSVRKQPQPQTQSQAQSRKRAPSPQGRGPTYGRPAPAPVHPLIVEHRTHFLVIEEQTARHALRREQQEHRTAIRKAKVDGYAALREHLLRTSPQPQPAVIALHHHTRAASPHAADAAMYVQTQPRTSTSASPRNAVQIAEHSRQRAVQQRAAVEKRTTLHSARTSTGDAAAHSLLARHPQHAYAAQYETPLSSHAVNDTIVSSLASGSATPVRTDSVGFIGAAGLVSTYQNEVVYSDAAQGLSEFVQAARGQSPDRARVQPAAPAEVPSAEATPAPLSRASVAHSASTDATPDAAVMHSMSHGVPAGILALDSPSPVRTSQQHDNPWKPRRSGSGSHGAAMTMTHTAASGGARISMSMLRGVSGDSDSSDDGLGNIIMQPERGNARLSTFSKAIIRDQSSGLGFGSSDEPTHSELAVLLSVREKENNKLRAEVSKLQQSIRAGSASPPRDEAGEGSPVRRAAQQLQELQASDERQQQDERAARRLSEAERRRDEEAARRAQRRHSLEAEREKRKQAELERRMKQQERAAEERRKREDAERARREEKAQRDAELKRQREERVAAEKEKQRDAEEAKAKALAEAEERRGEEARAKAAEAAAEEKAAAARKEEEEKAAAEAKKREEEAAAAEAKKKQEEAAAEAAAQKREEEEAAAAAAVRAREEEEQREAAAAAAAEEAAKAEAKKKEEEAAAAEAQAEAEAKKKKEEEDAAAAAKAEEEAASEAERARQREEAAATAAAAAKEEEERKRQEVEAEAEEKRRREDAEAAAAQEAKAEEERKQREAEAETQRQREAEEARKREEEAAAAAARAQEQEAERKAVAAKEAEAARRVVEEERARLQKQREADEAARKKKKEEEEERKRAAEAAKKTAAQKVLSSAMASKRTSETASTPSISTVNSTSSAPSGWYAKWSNSKSKYFFVNGTKTQWDCPEGVTQLQAVGGPQAGQTRPIQFYLPPDKQPPASAATATGTSSQPPTKPQAKPVVKPVQKPAAKPSRTLDSDSSSSEVLRPTRRAARNTATTATTSSSGSDLEVPKRRTRARSSSSGTSTSSGSSLSFAAA